MNQLRKDYTPKVGFISLGCPKALVDSERILTQLRNDGYELVNSYNNANVVIVNTCGFIDSAVAESLNAIGEAIEKNGKVIVTGCLGKFEDQILDVHPKVLAISGPHAYEEVMGHVYKELPKPDKNPHIDLLPNEGVKLTPRHYSYLKIAEGCNHNCSFCIIPDIRGKHASYEIGSILKEAEGLVNSGVKELLIVSQDTSAYGVDVKYKTGFYNGAPIKSNLKSLIEELSRFNIWTRLHYAYPYPNIDELIPLMAEGKLLPYLDIPFQHADYEILKCMKRPAYSEKVIDRILKWREIVPDIAIRSTFIVGFPGETEKQFNTLLTFLEEAQLDRVGAFMYSNVSRAQSAKYLDQVPEEVKQDRLDRLMQLQANISRDKLSEKVGSVQPVIIDEILDDKIIARTVYDAPQIDGQVIIKDIEGVSPGEVIHVEIDDSDEHDLWATPI